MIYYIKLKRFLKKNYYKISGHYNHLKQDIKINKVWYGNYYGGFYIYPNILNDNSVVLSFGIGEDISFDEDIIAKHKCVVFGFDPTPKSIDWVKKSELPSLFHFLPYGIGTENCIKQFFLPNKSTNVSGSFVIQNNVNKSDHIYLEIRNLIKTIEDLNIKKIDVLKMDIEGAEYEMIDSIINSPIEIKQLLIEFHERFIIDGKNKTTQAIKKLKDNGFYIFGISDTFEEISFINIKNSIELLNK